MTNTERQSTHMRARETQKRRSRVANFGRFFMERRRTLIWWRKAKFSSWSSALERTSEHNEGIRTREIGIDEMISGKSINRAGSVLSEFSRGTVGESARVGDVHSPLAVIRGDGLQMAKL